MKNKLLNKLNEVKEVKKSINKQNRLLKNNLKNGLITIFEYNNKNLDLLDIIKKLNKIIYRIKKQINKLENLTTPKTPEPAETPTIETNPIIEAPAKPILKIEVNTNLIKLNLEVQKPTQLINVVKGVAAKITKGFKKVYNALKAGARAFIEALNSGDEKTPTTPKTPETPKPAEPEKIRKKSKYKIKINRLTKEEKIRRKYLNRYLKDCDAAEVYPDPTFANKIKLGLIRYY